MPRPAPVMMATSPLNSELHAGALGDATTRCRLIASMRLFTYSLAMIVGVVTR